MTVGELADGLRAAFPAWLIAHHDGPFCSPEVNVKLLKHDSVYIVFRNSINADWHCAYPQPARAISDLAAAIAIVDAERLKLIESLLLPSERIVRDEPKPAVNCPHCDDKGGVSACNLCGRCASCKCFWEHAPNCFLGKSGFPIPDEELRK